jgi:iron complex outermembrane receptor protein
MRYGTTLGAAIGALLSVTAQAQQPASSGSVAELEDVTVTAQRRAERLQETPVAISAFDEESLRFRQIERMDDLARATPNVTIEPTPSATNGAKVFIRGIGTDESLFTADPAVAIYIDDVYVPRIQGSLFALYDIERVEVLRGPQGTLYGRNATNGAVRYITRKPSLEPSFTAQANFGNYSRTDFRLSGGGPITDTLSWNAGVMYLNHDGTAKNLSTGREVNDNQFRAARIQLNQKLGEESNLLFAADYLQDRSTPYFPVGIGRDFPETNLDGDLFTFNSRLTPADGLNEMDQWGASVTWTAPLGELDLTAVAAYRTYDWDFYSDFDGVDAIRLHLTQLQRQRNYSGEIRIASEAGALKWSSGLYYLQEKNFQPTRQDVFAIGGTNLLRQETKAWAAYFDGTYAVTERLRVTAGLRYSSEEKDFSVAARNAAGNPTFNVALADSWSTPTYRVVLDYDLMPDMMAYVSYATGFKSGAFNGRGATVAAITPVDEEEVKTAEAGIKSEWLNRRLRANATYFRTVYQDLQVNGLSPTGVFTLVNAAEAEFQGVELELAAVPFDGLQLTANVGTLDAKFTKSRPGSGFNSALEPKGAPELTWNVGATYQHAAGPGRLSWTANASHSSDYFQNTANNPTIKTDDHTLLNARVAYLSPNGTWEAALWGRNLSDEQYYTGGLYVAAIRLETAFINFPRTYGVEFTYRWGR